MDKMIIIYRILYKTVVNILAIGLVALMFRHIQIDSIWILLLVALTFTLFNIVIKPFLLLLSLPLIVITMGLGYVLINALILIFVSSIVSGFTVDGLWVAVGASIIISIINMFADAIANQYMLQRVVQKEDVREEIKEEIIE